MPPPTWQNTQGKQQLPYQLNDCVGRIGAGRQRASTMTDQLSFLSHPSTSVVISSEAVSDTQDYFTYLSAQNQNQSINIQSSSPPLEQVLAPEIRIPEIRLAPPNNDARVPSPEYADRQGKYFWYSPTSPAIGRSRDRSISAHSLAPPSIISEVDDSPFFSARQSFEISPSNSFDHQNQLMSAIMGIPKQRETTGDGPSDVLQLHVPSHEGGISSLLYPNMSPRHYREISDFSYSSKNYINNTSSPYNWAYSIDVIGQALLPTLQEWRQKSMFSKMSALAAAPLVLIFTMTLPVAEVEQVQVDDIEVAQDIHDQYVTASHNNLTIGPQNYLSVPTTASENEFSTDGKILIDDIDTKQGWNKHLLVIQSAISTTFIFGVFAGNAWKP